MSNGWATFQLGEIVEMQSGGTPSKSEPQYWGGDIPWISGASLHTERLRDSDRKVTLEAIGNGTRLAPAEATLILVRGMSLNNEIRVGRAVRPVAFNQDVKALVPNSDVLEPRFLTYLLLSRRADLLRKVHQAGHGTGVLATEFLQRLTVTIPGIDEQRLIADALSAIDDLIDVNRRLAADLDAIVRAHGRQFVTSIQGRSRTAFSEIGDVSKGYSYKSSELVTGGDLLVNLKNVGRSGAFQSRGFKPLSATVKPHQVVENGSILVAQTDLTQDREVIARPVRVRCGSLVERLVASLDLVIVRPKSHQTNESIFAILDSDDFRRHALGYCNGTTVVHMASNAIPSYLAPLPTEPEVAAFTAVVRPLRDAADGLCVEAGHLESTRDALLPLLISGRITMEEVAA